MKLLLGACLLLLTVGAANADATVTLPDTSAYTYWVQSPTGTVAVAPTKVAGHADFLLPPKASSGTLYVLDHHTGEIATVPITGQDLKLTVSEFQPQTTPAAAPAPAAEKALPPVPAPVKESAGSGILRLLTLVFGLAVACGVGWVIWRLIDSRGQPLIDAARRLGVDVPDPTAPLDEAAAPVYTPPAPRAVEKIPEEAGAVPPPVAPKARAMVGGIPAEPQIVGIQGLAAGMVFAVPMGDVSIGRDGDNSIVLAEHTVSRVHAKISRDGSGPIHIADAGSANGVYVNGNRITETTLMPGDQIQIGDNHFRFDA